MYVCPFIYAFIHTVGFYGGKSRENHLFRLYFLKISFCNLFKVVYHHLIPHLVKITILNVVFYTPSKNTIRVGGKFLNLHSLIFSLLLFYTQKTAPKSY
jgi:hypothetical protein